MTSVTVVNTTPPASAGSMDMRFSTTGIKAPASAPTTRLIIMAMAITIPRPALPYQRKAMAATMIENMMPLSMPTASSLRKMAIVLRALTCPVAMPRIISVSVWVPAMPPMLITTGNNTASSTNSSRVGSKAYNTTDANRAVIRFTPNQTQRRRADCITGANISSSSSRPAAVNTMCSPSSRMTSTTSSIVIRPSSNPS